MTFVGNGRISANGDATVGIYYNPTSYADQTTRSATTGNPYTHKVTLTDSATLAPYMLVNDIYDLQAMNTRLNGYYALGKDIDASATASWNNGKGFIPIGSTSGTFSGRFFGDDQVVSGLFINDPNLAVAGLFGVIGANGRVSHVGLSNANVTGSEAGILAGQNYGNITKTYATGNVIGLSAGGLTGRNMASGSISQSFSAGTVTGLDGGSVGGLTSTNQGSISDSFSTASVSLTFTSCGDGCYQGAIGGLAASHLTGALNNTYATGLLNINGRANPNYNGLFGGGGVTSTTASSYWNTETTGQSSSPGGIGKTTAEMTQRATYADWDFEAIWNIDEGAGFPFLKWANIVFNDPSKVLTPTPRDNLTSEGNRASKIADVCALAPVVCKPELAPIPNKSSAGGVGPVGSPVLVAEGSKAKALCVTSPVACSRNEKNELQIGSIKLYNTLVKMEESQARNEEILSNPDFIKSVTGTFLSLDGLRVALTSVRLYTIIATRLETESLTETERVGLIDRKRTLKDSVMKLLSDEKTGFLSVMVNKFLERGGVESERSAADVAARVESFRSSAIPVAGGGLFSARFTVETGAMALELFQNAAGLNNLPPSVYIQTPMGGGNRG